MKDWLGFALWLWGSVGWCQSLEGPMMMSMLNPGARGGSSLQYTYDHSLASDKTQGTTEWGARVSSTLIKSESDSLMASASYSQLNIRDDITIPARSDHPAYPVPHQLESVSVGGSWNHPLAEGRAMGVMASVGSDSDQPFVGPQETTINVTGLYHLAPSGPNQWHLALNYSNNRPFANGVPLPGFLYSIMNIQKRLFALLGFPFAVVTYGYAEKWEAKVAYVVPYGLLLENAYKWNPYLRTYARFEVQQKTFLLANRMDRYSQLFYRQPRLSIGTSVPIAPKVMGDLSAGYAFNRRVYESQGFQAHSALAEIPDTWFVRLQASYRF